MYLLSMPRAAGEIINEQKASGQMLATMFPYLITILLFAGTMSLGVDTITGEKERGTMASMLVTPVKRAVTLSLASCWH